MLNRSLSREEVRDIARRAIEEYGMPGVVLMENAGRGTAELLVRLGCRGPVAVFAGKGNNGGDGFVIARHLDNHDIPVKILLLCRPGEIAGDAAINFRIVEAAGLSIHVAADGDVNSTCLRELAGTEWIVDSLLGTGTRGEVREPFVTAIRHINGAPARVLAVDLPSGLNCDTGRPLGACVKAEHTATFVARKL
ncbi:MAG: NAD(P)H-hydrate epimerase, partial [Pirellulaceae bacterium]